MTFEAPSVAQSAMAAAMSGCASSMWAVFTMLRCDVDLWGPPNATGYLCSSQRMSKPHHAYMPVSSRPENPSKCISTCTGQQISLT